MWKIVLLFCIAVVGCTRTSNPDPSPLFDGRYTGTRVSNRVDACGLDTPDGRTTAIIRRGEISMPLFSPKTLLTGSVGEDGQLRASGIWTLRHGFPRMTVLTGHITGDQLEGEATDFHCDTVLRLHKIKPRRR